jgi:hypothetical protein
MFHYHTTFAIALTMIICLYTDNKSNDEDTTLAELAVGSVVIVAPATGFPPLKKIWDDQFCIQCIVDNVPGWECL